MTAPTTRTEGAADGLREFVRAAIRDKHYDERIGFDSAHLADAAIAAVRAYDAAHSHLAPQPVPVVATGAGPLDLLPCPFCGGPAFDDFDDPDGTGHIVGCENRACPINPEKFMDHVGEDHDVRIDLARAWNTRGKA